MEVAEQNDFKTYLFHKIWHQSFLYLTTFFSKFLKVRSAGSSSVQQYDDDLLDINVMIISKLKLTSMLIKTVAVISIHTAHFTVLVGKSSTLFLYSSQVYTDAFYLILIESYAKNYNILAHIQQSSHSHCYAPSFSTQWQKARNFHHQCTSTHRFEFLFLNRKMYLSKVKQRIILNCVQRDWKQKDSIQLQNDFELFAKINFKTFFRDFFWIPRRTLRDAYNLFCVHAHKISEILFHTYIRT